MGAAAETIARSVPQALSDEVSFTPYNELGLPLFIEPRTPALKSSVDKTVAWLRDNGDALNALARDAGAIVLRGFPLKDTDDFARMVEHFPSTTYGYAGGAAQRNNLKGKVFETTHAAAHTTLCLHQEMSYLPHYPSQLAFFCQHAADSGGETWIGDMRRAQKLLPQKFVNAVRQRGVLYTRNWRAPGSTAEHPLIEQQHRTWHESFYTTDKSKAEEACRGMGVEHTWEPDGGLTIRFRASGFVTHPVTGEEVWFNQAHAQTMVPRNIGQERYDLYQKYYPPGRLRPMQTTFRDGEPFDPADVEAVLDVMQQVTVAFPWRAGDMMLVDNIYTAHGRNSYTGRRDVQVSLVK